MVLAVLEAHCGVRLGDCDVYLNVAGGLRIAEPAADLAVAAALVSSRLVRGAAGRHASISARSACPAPCARSPHAAARLKEAQKLGFSGAYPAAKPRMPAGRRGTTASAALADLVAAIAAMARSPRLSAGPSGTCGSPNESH